MSNKQNDIIRETAYEAGREYEAHCEDMRIYALEQQLEELQKSLVGLRLDFLARKVEIKALNKRLDVQSQRIDRIVAALDIGPDDQYEGKEVGEK